MTSRALPVTPGGELGTVYLLHFHEPIGRRDVPQFAAQHYLGWARDLGRRIEYHRAGTGASITAYLRSRGIGFDVVRTWERVDRAFERRLKRRHGGYRPLCPTCSGTE